MRKELYLEMARWPGGCRSCTRFVTVGKRRKGRVGGVNRVSKQKPPETPAVVSITTLQDSPTMSSQGFAGEDDIFLSVARHQQQFRLLELPQELLELLNNPDAPWSVHLLSCLQF